MLEFMQEKILGNSLWQWAIAAGILVLILLLFGLFRWLAKRRLKRLAERNKTYWYTVFTRLIANIKIIFLLVIAVYFATLVLTLPGKSRTLLASIAVIAFLLQAGMWGMIAIATLSDGYRKKAAKENPSAVTTISLLAVIGRFLLWSVIVLLALQNLGVNVTALVAGLGIGGVAVALALQNVLGDLFGSLSILLDKPFVVGDFIIIDNYMGSVEHIGLKTTRIRSLSGEQLVFANSDLLKSRLRNYGRMYERRVAFNLGVTYETPRDKLKMIPGIIKEAIEAQTQTRFDRAHFAKYANFALEFETVYYVLTPDYNQYMDIQQNIYFQIHEQFEAQNIDFAYPTQTLYVNQASGTNESVTPRALQSTEPA